MAPAHENPELRRRIETVDRAGQVNRSSRAAACDHPNRALAELIEVSPMRPDA